MLHQLLGLNWQVFEVINQPAGHEPALDPTMVFGANDAILILPLLLLILWLGLARWAPAARRVAGATGSAASAGERARGLGQRLALLGGVAVVIAIALNVLLGHLLFEPRPFVSHPGVVHQLIAHAADASFPSDHEAVAAAIATVLVAYPVRLLRQRRAVALLPGGASSASALSGLVRLAVPLAILALVCAAYVGVSRIYVGVHYPGDILGGAICGTIAGLWAASLRPLAEPVLTPLVKLAESLRLA
jgi:undecaprenyl-diphosphatase